MLVKSHAKSWGHGISHPGQIAHLIFDEKCAICTREIPDGALLLRNPKTDNVICLLCIYDIASIEI